jgi:class 3 adenylate cyclase
MDRRPPTERLQASVQEFICNIIASMLEVSRGYEAFLRKEGVHSVDPPRRLRCGIARGTVIPIGQGADFVGPCINISTRLQKLHNLFFACSARGIDREGFNPNYGREFQKLRTEIRGIGERELVYVLRREFEALPAAERTAFLEP